MNEFNCSECGGVRRENAVRGKVFYRCFHQDAGTYRGRVVNGPLPVGTDARKIGIISPAWCPCREENKGESTKRGVIHG